MNAWKVSEECGPVGLIMRVLGDHRLYHVLALSFRSVNVSGTTEE
jgi:hypothetical protein